MAKKKLYALLVGIDKYPPGVRSLKGCVNDMNAFKDYLLRQCSTAEYDPKISILSNEKAKRQDLIAAFDHFSKAKNGDICVFYFIGHGSRILSSDFWEAFDGKNEAIVCHDACVVDKELSCLIYEATKGKSLHFLTVMDCCYSGGNSRDDAEAVNRLSRPNRYPVSIEEYHGYKEGWYFRDANVTYTAPKGKHLHFAACRNHQTDKETEKEEGVGNGGR